MRVAEAIFQPLLLGIDQSGFGETLGNVIARLARIPEARGCLENVFITGGCAKLPGFKVCMGDGCKGGGGGGEGRRILRPRVSHS